ncbi:hypothetical protein [Pyxidicoccus trucidator]|uniref:hypothetical protein n=1 Tax=Pyxidicoccus trucidator TaxID=2709662 RepID=UPI0013DADEE5|nr:hypothetical protein [Pyxidicoccus trucidator]
MHHNWTRRFFATAFLTLAGCQGEVPADGSESSLDAQPSQVESGCTEYFKGIETCALGSATVDRGVTGLEVGGLKDSKSDGISSTFEDASGWSHEAVVDELDSLTLTALDGDKVLSTLELTTNSVSAAARGAGGMGFQTGLVVNYDSPWAQYQIDSYTAAGLDFSVQSSGYVPLYIRWNWPGNGLYWRPTYRPVFYGARKANSADSIDGAVWGIAAGKGEAFVLVVDGKEVESTYVEITVKGAASPYSKFTGMAVKGSAKSITVASESVGRK